MHVISMNMDILGMVSGIVDDVTLNDGESFYVVVKATNALGHVISHHSNGVTIILEPLVPGIVRDGDVIGTDLNFWPHIDHLTANWDSFGNDQDLNMDIMNNGNEKVFQYSINIL